MRLLHFADDEAAGVWLYAIADANQRVIKLDGKNFPKFSFVESRPMFPVVMDNE